MNVPKSWLGVVIVSFFVTRKRIATHDLDHVRRRSLICKRSNAC